MNFRYSLSYWEAHEIAHHSDYMIIGAGIVGLAISLYLKKINPDARITVIERMPIGAGASSRNAGFACIGSVSEILHDISVYGEEKAIDIVSRRLNGLKNLFTIVDQKSVSYDPEAHGCELLNIKYDHVQMRKQIEYLNRALQPITGLDHTFNIVKNTGLRGFHDHMIINEAEGLLNTGKLYQELEKAALSCDVKILRGLTVREYLETTDKVEVHFKELGNPLSSQFLILCTNAFSHIIDAQLSIQPVRNQVIVTSPVDTSHLPYGYHYDQGYTYFRQVDGRVLIGGARNKFASEDGQTDFDLDSTIKEYLVEFLRQRLLVGQEFTIDYHWSGILCGGEARDPIVQQLSDRVFAGVRLGGMGVAIGSNIAQDLATLVASSTL